MKPIFNLSIPEQEHIHVKDLKIVFVAQLMKNISPLVERKNVVYYCCKSGHFPYFLWKPLETCKISRSLESTHAKIPFDLFFVKLR